MPKGIPIAAAFVLVVAVGCAQGTTTTPSSDAAVSPAATPTTEPAPTLSAQPSSPGAGFDLVATIVERLSVRRGPGTDSERIGFLPLGSVGLVLSGPVDIGGVPWYQLTGMGLSYATGCLAPPPDQTIECPGWHGWVAGADAARDPWLEPAAPSCPQPPLTIETISETQPGLRLVCWSGQEVTFRAWWPIIPTSAGAGLGGACGEIDLAVGWLLCQNINYNRLAANEAEGWSERLYLSVDPNSGVTMPERGQWVEVVGHFDDPAASLCADGPQARDEDPAVTVFWCRLQFVPRSVTAVAGS